ncbi:MAG: glycogen synthase [Anaerolineales bacterium]|nr:glycogen synthase [Anaerolineales bacterium]
MKVLMLAAEAAPLVMVGGLGDVVRGLSGEMRALGHDVRIALPHYGFISDAGEPVSVLSVRWGRSNVKSSCVETEIHGIPCFLIGGRPIVLYENVYSPNDKIDAQRFVFFSLASLQHMRVLGFQPDVVHVHDAHPGAALHWLSQDARTETFWRDTARVLTIHNMAYQYNEASEALALGGLRPSMDIPVPTWAGAGLLTLGIIAADRINAVSPTYAKEIVTEKHGAGLHTLLAARSKILSGILNGIDYQIWDPAVDDVLVQNYTTETLKKRESNKRALQMETGLPIGRAPLLGVVSRLDRQKGLDLLVQVMPSVMREIDIGLVVLGNGDAGIQAALQQLGSGFPERVAVKFHFDEGLARRIYAGADMMLVPSRYEPCGLVQIIALRYGAVPLVRATGGLCDTVKDCDLDAVNGTGFVFDAFTPEALRSVLIRALTHFEDKSFWRGVQRRGMALDFSWVTAGRRYQELYRQAIDDHRASEVD